MRAALEVLRYDPQSGGRRRRQRYQIDMPEGATVLEALMAVQDELDGTLAFRRACRHAICGSCGMRINGCAKLACNTQVSLAMDQAAEMARAPGRRPPVADAAADDAGDKGDSGKGDSVGGEGGGDGEGDSGDKRGGDQAGPPAIRIEPLGNMAVVKDLVTDMDEFWAKQRDRRPWLFPPVASPGPDDEFRVSPQQSDILAQGVLCLECGLCYSDCNAVEAEPRFVGPAALVKAHRYSFDPRDDAVHERALDLSNEHGLWECMRCYFCTQRCPKHIRVRELIAQLGERAVGEGLDADPGARHAQAFVDSLRRRGRLNETNLAVKSQGWTWAARRLPLAVRVALAGKLALPPRPIDGHDALLAVMAQAEKEES